MILVSTYGRAESWACRKLQIDDRRTVLKKKQRLYFEGKIIRKDLTKNSNAGANVSDCVLEFLLGEYPNLEDFKVIEHRVENVKRILKDNIMCPDKAQQMQHIKRWTVERRVICGMI